MIARGQQNYNNTPLKDVHSIDVSKIKVELNNRLRLLGAQARTQQGEGGAATRDADADADAALPAFKMVLFGELMCNKGLYDYQEAGLSSRWLCFGARLLPVNQTKESFVLLRSLLIDAGFLVSGSNPNQPGTKQITLLSNHQFQSIVNSRPATTMSTSFG